MLGISTSEHTIELHLQTHLLGRGKSLQKLKNPNSVVWLGGDFNLPNIDWEDNVVKQETPKVRLGNRCYMYIW